MELFFLFEFIYFLKQRDFWKKSSWALMWPFRVSVWCGPSYFLNGLLCTPVNSHPGFHPSTFCFLIWGQALLSCGAIFFCLLSSQFLYYHSHCWVLLAPLSQREEQSLAPRLLPTAVGAGELELQWMTFPRSLLVELSPAQPATERYVWNQLRQKTFELYTLPNSFQMCKM